MLVRQPPAVERLELTRDMENDMSACVRVHRGDRAIDVWLVTPLSAHWDEDAVAQPVAAQLERASWALAAAAPGVARFQRRRPAPAGAGLARAGMPGLRAR